MDYEKRYKEALERAKRFMSIRGVSPEEDPFVVAKELCEDIFPELKESEDERIRKVIVKYFEELHEQSWINLEIPDILAWLEKQKDASKAIEAVERIDKYVDEHLANAHDMKDSNPDKKYYRGWDDALGKMAGILQDVYSDEKQKEQKPVEYLDKDKVYAIMTKLTNLSYSQLIPINSDEYKKLDEITTDVRSLLDYPIEQKPAEWQMKQDHDRCYQCEKNRDTVYWKGWNDCKAKMLKDAVEGVMIGSIRVKIMAPLNAVIEREGLEDGDKVKVIIVKED